MSYTVTMVWTQKAESPDYTDFFIFLFYENLMVHRSSAEPHNSPKSSINEEDSSQSEPISQQTHVGCRDPGDAALLSGH